MMDERELLLIRNFGEKSFRELIERMIAKKVLPKEDEGSDGR